MSCVSALQKARYSYQPKLPATLRAGAVVKCTEGEKLAAFADKEKIFLTNTKNLSDAALQIPFLALTKTAYSSL